MSVVGGGAGKVAAADRLKSTSINGVKMYWVSGQKSLATWLPPKKLKALRKNKSELLSFLSLLVAFADSMLMEWKVMVAVLAF